MKVTSAAKVGFTAIIIALVMIGIYRGLGWRIPGLSGPGMGKYTINVSFKSVKGLNPGADVQLNGNPVGEVGDITNDGFGGVLVQLLIDKRQPIHEHSNFIITRDSIFGSYLVSIDESRSGFMSTDIVNGQFSVRVESGMVEEQSFLIHEGKTIGQIISVEPYDSRSDRVTINLADSEEVNSSMVFVPMRPFTDSRMGLVAYGKIPPDSIVEGVREPGPEDLIANADRALQEITGQTSAIMMKLGDLLENIEEILSPEDIRRLLDELAAEASAIAQNIVELTDRLNVILAETQPHLIGTMENIEGVTEEAHELIEGLGMYNSPTMRKNIEQLVANLTEASDKMVDILEDIEGYSSDDVLKEDITGTIHEARLAIEQARGTLVEAEEALDDVRSGMDVLTGVEAGGEFRIRHAPDPDRWSGDVNIRVGMEQSDAYVVAGIDDIGENERLNAQIGWWIGDDSSARIGVRRGKLGLGADWRSEAVRVVSDLYDLNDLQWDVYGGYAIVPELDIIIGVEDILDDNEMNFGLAFRF